MSSTNTRSSVKNSSQSSLKKGVTKSSSSKDEKKAAGSSSKPKVTPLSAFSVAEEVNLDEVEDRLSIDDLIGHFRATMSDLLDERLAAIVAQNADLQRDVSELTVRVQELETQNVALADTVRFLTEDAPGKPVPHRGASHPVRYGTVQSTVQCAPKETVSLTEVIAEEVDRAQRANNAIVKGIPEAQDESDDGLRGACMEVLGIPDQDFVSVARVGRLDREDRTGPRHVKVIFKSAGAKERLYKRRFKIKHNDKPIIVNHDLTRTQQKQRRKAVPTYKALRTKGITCSIPYGVIINEDGDPMPDDVVKDLLSEPAVVASQA